MTVDSSSDHLMRKVHVEISEVIDLHLYLLSKRTISHLWFICQMKTHLFFVLHLFVRLWETFDMHLIDLPDAENHRISALRNMRKSILFLTLVDAPVANWSLFIVFACFKSLRSKLHTGMKTHSISVPIKASSKR